MECTTFPCTNVVTGWDHPSMHSSLHTKDELLQESLLDSSESIMNPHKIGGLKALLNVELLESPTAYHLCAGKS